jgi:hypothetical protein
MLRIIINGTDVDLSDNIQIDLKISNPLLSESGFDEAYSYSFQIPKTAKNKGVVNRMASKKATIRILFSNTLIDEGTAIIKTNISSYSVDFKNQSLELKNTLANINLKSLPLESIDVCEGADSPTTKLSKWNAHLTQTTITDPVNEGSHKFPHINAWDATADSGFFVDMNNKNPDWITFFDVNAFYNGEYLSNVGWPTSYNGGQPAWWTTISPCIRIQYLFDQVIEFLTLTISKDELSEITEFQQMIHYSLLAMDKVEVASGLNFNVHGTTINLTKFTPDLSAAELFKLLDEIFGIFFSFRNNKLSIRLKKNVFNFKPEDYSKFCNPDFETELTEGTSTTFKYPIEIDALNRFGDSIWAEDIWVDGVETEVKYHSPRTIGKEESLEEIEVSYIPMTSRVLSFDRIFDYAWDLPIVESLQTRTYFFTPYKQISSYYEDAEYLNGGSEKFIIGLCRGVYPLYNFDTLSYDDKPVFCNLNKFYPIAVDEDGDYHNYKFGSCSLYFNDPQSHVDVYLKRAIDFIKRSKSITKLLYLPLHKILEITSWSNPNHIIKQRNLSFKGTVREVNFTLYKNSISPCSIVYAVPEKEVLGDYNEDYNTDFIS